jgi:lipopolysaccharide transport protein LptA
MKTFLMISIAVIPFAVLLLNGQTNSPAPLTNAAVSEVAPIATTSSGETNSAGRQKMEIYSDRAELDVVKKDVIYIGNVRFIHPQMTMTCQKLSLSSTNESNRPRRIVAERDVVIWAIDDKGRTNRAIGGRAVYSYGTEGGVTNEIVELSVNPQVDTPEVTITGEIIYWDRMRNTTDVRGGQKTFVWPESQPNTNLFPPANIADPKP